MALREACAWVSQRGGVLGLGSRRIMGVGLALLQAVSVSELRAILAHEFGHYFGGDVRLGPLVYRTREALVRTVVALHEHSRLLKKPFEWYAALFFRVTHPPLVDGFSRFLEHPLITRDVQEAEVVAPPGAPVVLRRGERQVEVFALRKRVEDDPAGWQAFCAETGLVGPLA